MDRSLHPARPQNQTLVLSNHLVITTVEFLNKFAEECDAKLCNCLLYTSPSPRD